MATLALIDAYLSIAGKDLSPWVRSVTINYAAELLDETAMGDLTRKNIGGLKNWSIAVEFKQDFGSTPAPDIDLFALVGTAVAVVVRPVKGSSVGATNPEYTGTGILESYTPIGNGVGELALAPINIQCAGPLTRATS